MCKKKENVNIDLSNIKMANTKYCWDESIGRKYHLHIIIIQIH